jgi:SAM-dependent methyltransferase
MPEPRPYLSIVRHYEACLERHGDNHLGVDWPKPADVDRRYAVMLDVVRPGRPGPERPARLLDFGCGASHLYDYLQRRGLTHLAYSGLDLSDQFIRLCRAKYPTLSYYCVDVLQPHVPLPRFDYVVMNGVFTEKRDLSFEQMEAYFRRLLCKAYEMADVGLAFNVMSKHVDWERDDLFHLPLDTLAQFLTRDVSRHYAIRNDYGLYEYTVYVYREPVAWPA